MTTQHSFCRQWSKIDERTVKSTASFLQILVYIISLREPFTVLQIKLDTSADVLQQSVLHLHLLPNLGAAACCWKTNTQETSIRWKGQFALFRRLTTRGEGRVLSTNPIPKIQLNRENFEREKGEFNLNLVSQGGAQSLHDLPLCADVFLIGWWGGKRVVLQEFCAQPEVSTLHLGGCANSCRTQR